jgi:hypothetical protein
MAGNLIFTYFEMADIRAVPHGVRNSKIGHKNNDVLDTYDIADTLI